MSTQTEMSLTGRAPDPILQEVTTHPRRTVDFDYLEFAGNDWVKWIDSQTGEEIGRGPISYKGLKASRRRS